MIAVIVKGWPRLSETFIARELEALEARGLMLDIWSLRQPADGQTQPVHRRVRAGVTYLPEYARLEAARVRSAWRRLRRLPGYVLARRLLAADWRRDPTRHRFSRFAQALVLAAEIKPETRLLYAHFIHAPCSVARYAAALTGLPFAASAHARDIWTSPDWDLAAKLAAASFVTTCTQDGYAHLRRLGPGTLHLNRHGLDLAHWPQAPARTFRDGSDPADPVIILSVGRAVEKKGYDVLLPALAGIDPALHWRFVHIGGGPLLPALQKEGAALGLEGRIDWCGAQSEDQVHEAMAGADLFALTPRIDAEGDRDGLPNALVEAQSQGLAVVATRIGGVGDLIEDGENGLLCASGEAPAIAAALSRLIADPAARAAMGATGYERVRTAFSAAPGADAIADLLRRAMA